LINGLVDFAVRGRATSWEFVENALLNNRLDNRLLPRSLLSFPSQQMEAKAR